jgi:N-acetylglucosamine kinase-like BadF-type ATPase
MYYIGVDGGGTKTTFTILNVMVEKLHNTQQKQRIMNK